MKLIEIYDTTLRDGEQAPGAAMHPSQKVEIALELQSLGVDTIEAGFPASSEKDAASVAEISRLCRTCRIAAFGRTTTEDVEAAIVGVRDAEHPRITLVMPASDLHMYSKLRINDMEALELLPRMVRMARNKCAEVEVIAEDSTRSRPEFITRLFQTAVTAGARWFTLA
ncbi:MAG: 2-isopropylmalate synthase, partial [Gemmatimonadaceae bacterium]|nr:2-isopropylmalate synthase [Gemmatimonadaceae bacterium]